MIKVLWLNFSGGYSSSSMFQLWESGMSLYMGDLVDNEIEKPKSVCNCGDLTACEANFKNINHYSIDIKAIQLDKQPVNYSKFVPVFYQLFEAALREKFPNAFCEGGRNLAITCQEEQLNVPEIVDKFLEQLTIKGFSFTRGALSEEKGENLPLQFDNDTYGKFKLWLEENKASDLDEVLEGRTAGLSL